MRPSDTTPTCSQQMTTKQSLKILQSADIETAICRTSELWDLYKALTLLGYKAPVILFWSNKRIEESLVLLEGIRVIWGFSSGGW
jgi:hypothetical protein